MAETPVVSLVVVNLNGSEHLGPCLDSVANLDYPRDRFETIVVDNGSIDGSVDLLERSYPWVRILALGSNVGFAAGVNAGASAASGECLATCNNDMRLDPAWLTELVRQYDPATDVSCVSGLILDWEGRHIDFADAFVTATGMAGQLGFGEPRDDYPIEDGRELLFACGGSMLVGRELFLGLGGFDPSFFALLEDVDLGWRLRLGGHRTRLAARAVSFHRHSATVEKIPAEERIVMIERNALRMLLKNVGDDHLAQLLAPALTLLAARNSRGVRRRALGAVLGAAADIGAERERVQRSRSQSDAEVFKRFGRPFVPSSPSPRYLATSAALTRHFGLGNVFPERRAASVLIVGDDAHRRKLARAAASVARVVYVAPVRVSIPRVETLVLDDAGALADEVDLVIDAAAAADLDGQALHRLLARPPRLGPPEDEQLLRAQGRRRRGVGQPAHERLARRLWAAIPEPLRELARS